MSINFGPLIKKRREEIGMTQEQLAQCLHLSRQSVSQWETEERQPTVAILEKLASVLQLSLKSLVSRASQEKDDQSITYSVRLDDGEYWVDIFFEMETYDYNVYLQKRGFKDKYFLLSEDAKTITFEDLCKTITHILPTCKNDYDNLYVHTETKVSISKDDPLLYSIRLKDLIHSIDIWNVILVFNYSNAELYDSYAYEKELEKGRYIYCDDVVSFDEYLHLRFGKNDKAEWDLCFPEQPIELLPVIEDMLNCEVYKATAIDLPDEISDHFETDSAIVVSLYCDYETYERSNKLFDLYPNPSILMLYDECE